MADPDAASRRLLKAIAEGATGQLQEAIAGGADVDYEDPRSTWTPLSMAARYARLEALHTLAHFGANVNQRCSTGDTALSIAVLFGEVESARVLCRLGADPKLKAANDETPLAIAERSGNATLSELLRAEAARRERRAASEAAGQPADATEDSNDSRDVTDEETRAAARTKQLLDAVKRGETDTLAALLGEDASGVDFSHPKSGWTPLSFAARYGRVNVLTQLLEAGADPNRRQTTGDTALFFAIMFGQADAVRALLAAGADVDLSLNGETPVAFAARSGEGAIADVLRAAGGSELSADARARREAEAAAQELSGTLDQDVLVARLIEAVRAGRPRTVESLLHVGADPDHAVGGEVAIAVAAAENQEDCLRVLAVAGGADVNRRSGPDGATPLARAVENSNPPCVRALCELGANVFLEVDERTPLEVAYDNEDEYLVTLLRDKVNEATFGGEGEVEILHL